MSATTHIQLAVRRVLVAAAVLAPLVLVPAVHGQGPRGPASIAAAFDRRSYEPGETARLHLWSPVHRVTVRVFRAGHGWEGRLQGLPVSPRSVVDGQTTSMRIGSWPSGLYYARVAADGRVGYAPFVVRPRRLGEHRVAVVLPTNTWQAYNVYDENGDGRPDSWYADSRVTSVRLDRPFADGGVPPHYRGYDRGFLRWLARTGKQPDFLSDDDLERVTGRELAQAYDLIAFSGHEEYVTAHAYDVTERYRDLGGNLAFLSANNFFYRVVRHGQRLERDGRWRDLGRPEARLVGIQYVDWNHGQYPNAPYVVTGVQRAPWLFRGTGLSNGDRFGVYGIEIDARTSLSPKGIRVLARIPSIFGPGKSAEMTYYTTPKGAKVFAAGSINFGGSALWPTTSKLLENLWEELKRA